MSYLSRMQSQILSILLTIFIANAKSEWMACPELSPVLRIPCKCRVEQTAVIGQSTSIGMDCDRIIFTTETPNIPKGAPISAFSQRHSGQLLPVQVSLLLLILQLPMIDMNLVRCNIIFFCVNEHTSESFHLYFVCHLYLHSIIFYDRPSMAYVNKHLFIYFYLSIFISMYGHFFAASFFLLYVLEINEWSS